MSEPNVGSSWPEFPPAATQVVDAGLQLFAYLLPLQDLATAGRIIQMLVDGARSPRFDRNIGRRAAAQVNASMAVLLSLRRAMISPTKQVRDVFGNASITTILSGFLKVGHENFEISTDFNTYCT